MDRSVRCKVRTWRETLLCLLIVAIGMADKKTEELLNTLNCSEYIQVFKDNDVDFETLKLLNENQVIALVPSIGKQARILEALKKLKSEDNEIEIEAEKEKENAKPSTSERGRSICRQNADTGMPLLKRLCSGVDNLDLEVFFESSCSGQAILKDYRNNNILSNRSRNSLVNLLIYHFLDKSIILSNREIEILATKIVDLFSNETIPTYYVGPTKIVVDGVMKSGIAKGKLIDKHRNALRELKKVGLFKKFQGSERSNKTVLNSDKNSNDSYLWLYNNKEPFGKAVHHWNETYPLRQNSNSTSVKDFLKEWPILYHTTAYSLIECDFATKYPESVMSMFKNFEKFMSGVKKHLPKKSGKHRLLFSC